MEGKNQPYDCPIAVHFIQKLMISAYDDSIIGSIFIIAGLYIVLWGKAKEMRIAETEALKSIAETEDLKSNNNGVIEIISFAGGNLATAAIVPELETDHQIVTTSAATLQEA